MVAGSIVHGKDGTAAIGGTNANITKWSIARTNETKDSTTFETTGDWRTFIDGLLSYTVAIEGYLDTANVLPAITGIVTVTLACGANTYTGAVRYEGINVDVDIEGAADFSLSGKGTGTLTAT